MEKQRIEDLEKRLDQSEFEKRVLLEEVDCLKRLIALIHVSGLTGEDIDKWSSVVSDETPKLSQ